MDILEGQSCPEFPSCERWSLFTSLRRTPRLAHLAMLWVSVLRER